MTVDEAIDSITGSLERVVRIITVHSAIVTDLEGRVRFLEDMLIDKVKPGE